MENYSVLMSVYGKENAEYLKQSIKSIMEQTVPTDDFWVVCDGPLTAELDAVIEFYLEKYPDIFHVLRLKENVGLGRALNAGLAKCKNDVVARMDSDDIALPKRCERQLEMMRKGVELTSGTVVEFDRDVSSLLSKRELPQTGEEIKKGIGRRNPFNHPCVMYRKSSVLSAGGYQHFYLFEDYYLWARMIKNGAIAENVKDVLLYMRAGEGMYERRGGWKYMKSMIRFRSFLLKNKLSSPIDFLITAGGQMVVCLIPNKLRVWFYQKFLRK